MLLANLSCFIDLHFKQSDEIYMSTRDVQTCSDILQAPAELQKWFGRPPITLEELISFEVLTESQLREYIVDADASTVNLQTCLCPAIVVWPMGFSWSSCIAQACTLTCCREAGVAETSFMSLDSPPPMGSEACGVATDDIFFIHKNWNVGVERLVRLDCVMEKHGMPKHASQDVTMQPQMVALGCELTSCPATAEPATAKVVPLFAALLGLVLHPQASPVVLNRALGVEQCFFLLQRPLFSILDHGYDFVRREPADSKNEFHKTSGTKSQQQFF